MHPFLLDLDGFILPSYGVAMAVGYLVAVLLAARMGQRHGLSFNRVLDLSFWLLAAGLLGSRLLFVVTNPGAFYQICAHGETPGPRTGLRTLYDCTRAFHFWEGGLVFYGAMLGILAMTYLYCRRHKMSLPLVADLAAPTAALGHFFGRMGCFAAGCCYGKPTGGWGLRFPPESLAYKEMVLGRLLNPSASTTPPLHATQLYEAGSELAIFFVLLWVNHRKRFTGQTILTYLMIYPLVRVIIELFRADPDRSYVVELSTPWLNGILGLATGAPVLLSTSQLISLLVLGAAVSLFCYFRSFCYNLPPS